MFHTFIFDSNLKALQSPSTYVQLKSYTSFLYIRGTMNISLLSICPLLLTFLVRGLFNAEGNCSILLKLLPLSPLLSWLSLLLQHVSWLISGRLAAGRSHILQNDGEASREFCSRTVPAGSCWLCSRLDSRPTLHPGNVLALINFFGECRFN